MAGWQADEKGMRPAKEDAPDGNNRASGETGAAALQPKGGDEACQSQAR